VNHSQPRQLLSLLLIGLMLFHHGAGLVAAQDRGEAGDVYRVSPGDVLRLNVPQEQSLDRELTVSDAGTVYLPQVGEVTLNGLTLPEAREFLTQPRAATPSNRRRRSGRSCGQPGDRPRARAWPPAASSPSPTAARRHAR